MIVRLVRDVLRVIRVSLLRIGRLCEVGKCLSCNGILRVALPR